MENEKEIWWNSLSKEVQESINHSLFNQKVFDLDIAFEKLSKIVK